MGINLQKGQKIDLRKSGTNNGLSRVMVGLGWDEAQQEAPKGFLAALFSSKPADIDCDASAIICGSNGKMKELVYYGALKSSNGAVQHQGDNLTGAGDGDDEQIMVDLNQLQSDVSKVVFIVNIYDANVRNQHFGLIRNAFIRLVDMSNNNEICRFNLSEKYSGMEGLIVCEIYRYNDDWKFNAIGQPVRKASRVTDITSQYA